MALKKCLVPFVLVFICSLSAFGQALVIQLSDSHSAYDKLPNFLRATDSLIREYKAKEPNGQVIVVVNGDYSGLSRWSKDNGQLGIDALGVLAKSAKVLFTLGNHDGFDWARTSEEHNIVYRQLHDLKQSGVSILGSNMVFSNEVSQLIDDHFEFVNTSGRRARFYGFGLEVFFSKSLWNPLAQFPILKKVRSNQEALRSVIQNASDSNINDLFLFFHEPFNNVKTLLRSVSHNNIRLAFAGHDHLELKGKVGDTLVVDSKSDYDFSVVELDKNNQPIQAKFFPTKIHSTLFVKSQIGRVVEDFAVKCETFVERIRKELQSVAGFTHGYNEVKTDLKKRREPLGTALADALAHWGQDAINQHPTRDSSQLEVVTLYNSSAYRRDEPIPAGDLTIETLRSFYPFLGSAKAFLVKGFEIQNLFVALRRYRFETENVYSPQLSSNLSETEPYQLNVDFNKSYVLVLDDWLSSNGYKLAAFEQVTSKKEIAAKKMSDIFEEYGPAVLRPGPYSPPIHSCVRTLGSEPAQ